MTVYIITILSAIILSWRIKVNKDNRRDKRLMIVLLTMLIIGLAFIVGYRYDVGTDFWEYKRMFSVYKSYSWKALFKIKEPGIRIIIKICAYISNDYSFFMFVCALITTMVPVIVLYRHSENFVVSIALYLFVNYLAQCNGMRQSLAMSIIFIGYKQIKEKNFWKFVIFPLLGTIFHVSSLFIIPLYFIYISKPGFWVTFVILAATLVLRFSYDWLVASVEFFKGEAFETNSYTNQTVNILRIAAMSAPIILTVLLPSKKVQSKSVAFNMILLNACVYMCMAGSAYFARLGMFTDMFLCIAIPAIISEYNQKDKELALLIVLTCYAIFFVFNTMRSGNLVPYQSVLW